MRVALVCPYSISLPGGVQGQVLGLAAALERRGCAVALVAPWDPPEDGASLHVEVAPRVQLIAAGTSLRVPVNGSRAPVALGPLSTWRAVRALTSWRPDVVHVHEPFVPGAALAALVARPAPVIGTFHRSGSGVLYRAARPLARAAFALLDDAVAVSGAARATLEEVLGGVPPRCDVVANGVDLERFEHAAPWPTEGPTLVFTGRHERRKGLAVLLEAFAALPGDVRLWVVSSGPETASLRSRFAADRRVEWCGRLSDAELARRLAGADLCVAPSLGGESFGVVLLEAMAAGTAVVASDIEGYRLAAGDAARLVPPGDSAALAGALRHLLGDTPARAALVAAGRARAAECSLGQVAQRYAARYERLVASGAAGGGGFGRRPGNGDPGSS